MNNAKLYQNSNSLAKRDALECLQDYGMGIKWKNDEITVIDIGCGDGSVTIGILKEWIPNKYVKMVGCDISENMIEFANEHYANDHTTFVVQDIEGDLRNELRGNFNHAFSFLALNWAKNQERAFTNIYDMLKQDGECFVVFFCQLPVFDVYRTLSRTTKWKFWLRNAERFISPYHDCEDPEKILTQIMTAIGFSSIEVKCVKKTFVYPDLDALKGIVLSISPFEIPKDLEEDFLQDYLNVLRDIHVIDNVSSNGDGPIKATFNYSLLLAKGKK